MVWKHEPRSARHNEILHFEKKKADIFLHVEKFLTQEMIDKAKG